jgi:hypothetical protein
MIFFFLVMVLGLELRAFTLSHSTSSFLWRFFFEIGSHKLFAQCWLRTVILLISASWVARIIGMSHWHPATGINLSNTWLDNFVAVWTSRNVIRWYNLIGPSLYMLSVVKQNVVMAHECRLNHPAAELRGRKGLLHRRVWSGRSWGESERGVV